MKMRYVKQRKKEGGKYIVFTIFPRSKKFLCSPVCQAVSSIATVKITETAITVAVMGE